MHTIEAVCLRDLSRLMVPPQQHNAVWIPEKKGGGETAMRHSHQGTRTRGGGGEEEEKEEQKRGAKVALCIVLCFESQQPRKRLKAVVPSVHEVPLQRAWRVCVCVCMCVCLTLHLSALRFGFSLLQPASCSVALTMNT